MIKTRISQYIQETRPISDLYRSENADNYHLIDANQEIELIHEDILKIAKNIDIQ